MDPASRKTAPNGPPNGVNFSSEAAYASHLYELAQNLVSTHTTTDKLAQGIFRALNQMQIYQLDGTPDLSTPYQVGEVKKRIHGLGPFDILHGVSHIIYMFLINDNNFKLYVKQQHKLCEVTEQLKEVSCCPKVDNGYVIFLSNQLLHKFQIHEVALKKEKNKAKFYYYCSFIKQSIESNEAPFHHEAQSSSACGLHAINAYIGCRYLSPEKFAKHVRDLSIMSGGSQETDSGLDPVTLQVVLEKIAKKGKVSSVNCIPKLITCSTDLTGFGKNFSECEKGLLEDFKCIDRFILGVTKSEAHFLAFRKDKHGRWWKIDSRLSKQECFADAQALIDEIKASYDSDLLNFIIPDRNQRIRRSSDN